MYTSAPPFLPPGTEAVISGPYAARLKTSPLSGPEGRALHAAKQTASKYTRLTVERHYTRLPERLGAGKSKTRAACHGGGAKKAVAAMTCPGVPTHRKRLRPAERVETESATYAECCSRNESGGYRQRRGRVAAQYRLSAPRR